MWYNGTSIGSGTQALKRLTFKLYFAPYYLCDLRQVMNLSILQFLLQNGHKTYFTFVKINWETRDWLGSGTQEVCVTIESPSSFMGNWMGLQPQVGPQSCFLTMLMTYRKEKPFSNKVFVLYFQWVYPVPRREPCIEMVQEVRNRGRE